MAVITVFLGGDVMTGRGVDQILPHPSTPQLWERHAVDARDYVALAEQANGPIPRLVPMSWPWGDALPVLDALAPDARIVNLETSITECSAAAAGKSVHYRMRPANVACLTAARLDACALANNHLLDFGVHGLTDTLDTLAAVGLATSGAGRTREQARRPVRVNGVVLTACAATSSGVPADWAATEQRPGVDLLADLRPATADTIATRARDAASCGDLVIVSIHWGANWGSDVPAEHIAFAHQLIDAGVDVVYGHSAHHPLPIEVYRDRLILYGCGDLIDDYEGITGYEQYRNDLRLLYLASFESGALSSLRIAPMQARRMQLHRASRADTEWLGNLLGSISGRPFAIDQDSLLAPAC